MVINLQEGKDYSRECIAHKSNKKSNGKGVDDLLTTWFQARHSVMSVVTPKGYVYRCECFEAKKILNLYIYIFKVFFINLTYFIM